MTTVLFIHGTGVRQKDYDSSLEQVETGLSGWSDKLQVVPCYWGHLGAELFLDGASIPEYTIPPDDEMILTIWRNLYQDPLYELRLLVLSKQHVIPVETLPGLSTPSQEMHEKLQSLAWQDKTGQLVQIGLTSQQFELARDTVFGSEPYQTLFNRLDEVNNELYNILARAIFATMLETHQGLIGKQLRTEILDDWQEQLTDGTVDMGLFDDYVIKPLKKQALLWGTDWGRDRRTGIMDYAYPFAGDIVRYQGRHGQTVRDFIVKQIKSITSEVVILAHSLGGIMAVDLLAEQDFGGQVKQLITVGSQAPLLYEIDALHNLPCQPDIVPEERLPAHFPSWLNVYDPRDLLSFRAEPVFGNRVTDKKVNSGEPFKESHSAYWLNDDVYQHILGVL